MRKLMSVAALCALTTPAFATDAPPALAEFALKQMEKVATNTAIIDGIMRQNEETASLSAEDIDALDREWRDGRFGSDSTLVNETLNNPVSEVLSELVGQSSGMISEVFVMDARGLNVGQSGVTSDYWQGDEAKFTETYPVGPDAMHVSAIELDESTSTYQGQVSITITHPETKAPIGAITFGIDATSFF